jgi:hypothetical protein
MKIIMIPGAIRNARIAIANKTFDRVTSSLLDLGAPPVVAFAAGGLAAGFAVDAILMVPAGLACRLVPAPIRPFAVVAAVSAIQISSPMVEILEHQFAVIKAHTAPPKGANLGVN